MCANQVSANATHPTAPKRRLGPVNLRFGRGKYGLNFGLEKHVREGVKRFVGINAIGSSGIYVTPDCTQVGMNLSGNSLHTYYPRGIKEGRAKLRQYGINAAANVSREAMFGVNLSLHSSAELQAGVNLGLFQEGESQFIHSYGIGRSIPGVQKGVSLSLFNMFSSQKGINIGLGNFAMFQSGLTIGGLSMGELVDYDPVRSPPGIHRGQILGAQKGVTLGIGNASGSQAGITISMWNNALFQKGITIGALNATSFGLEECDWVESSGKVHGILLGGINLSGAQTGISAAFINVAKDSVRGIAVSAFSYAGKLKGIGVSAITHIQELRGVSASVLENAGCAKGIKFSAASLTLKLKGVSASAFQWVGKAKGVVLSVISKVRELTGVSASFLYAGAKTMEKGVLIAPITGVENPKESTGIQIGLLNIRDGSGWFKYIPGIAINRKKR